jgi:hypothetical protein
MALTTDLLVSNIKRRTQLPDDGGTLSDADILAFATDELLNVVAPRLMAMQEWHYAYSYTETLSSARTIRINPRTAGNAIISVEYLDGTEYRFIRAGHPLTQRASLGESYAIYGNLITLSDAVPTSGTLRIRALLRPSRLIATGTCTAITSVGASNTLNLTSSTGFTANMLVDVQHGDSPYEMFLLTSVATVPGGVSITTADAITSTTFPVTSVRPGRLCPAEQTDRIQLPDELHDYLAQRTAIRCMEARGFTQDMQNHLRKLADLETAFDRLTAPRSRGEFKAIVPEDWMFAGRV